MFEQSKCVSQLYTNRVASNSIAMRIVLKIGVSFSTSITATATKFIMWRPDLNHNTNYPLPE